ncbi:hypothetical protein JHK82_042861 [Glycine max]|nr:hypothetical protein JHK82_042861 [Glycine max]
MLEVEKETLRLLNGSKLDSSISPFFQLLNSPWDVCFHQFEEKIYIAMAGQNQIWEHNLLDATTRVFSGDDYERNLNGSSNAAPKSVLHHYKRSFSGFVVKLTEEEANRIADLLNKKFGNNARLDGVVSVFPNGKKQLYTTNKIIGAKYYKTDGFKIKDLKSPRDIDDHGTHIASTAAGNRVSMASMLGLGQGTSRGGATLTCIAVYKACWNDHCDDADILAAFDDAIADGVDILSVSLGGSNDQNYFGDASSIGAFHAMKNGIVTLFAAGNSSPSPAFIDNLYPWSISVVASTLDKICWSPEQAIGVMSLECGAGAIQDGAQVEDMKCDEWLVEEKYNGAAGLVEARIEVQWGTGDKSGWLMMNLDAGAMFPPYWPRKFGIVLDLIWQWRNFFVFNGALGSDCEMMMKITKLEKELNYECNKF